MNKPKITRKILKSHKKSVIGCGIAGILLIALAAGGIVLHGRNQAAASTEMSVQSSEASIGTIRTTIEGTGTVENGAATDVIVPTGIKIKEVLVESGDEVTAGQTLATLDEASIASELLEVTESLESVKDEIDSLSGDAQTEGTTEYLEAKVLNGELSDLTEAKESLTSLLNTQAITASCDGIISSVNVSDDSEISQSASGSGSSGSSGDSSSDTAGNISASLSSESLPAASGSPDTYQIAFLTASDDSPAACAASDTSTAITEIALNITAPAAGAIPQKKLNLTDEEASKYAGTLTWNCPSSVFQSGVYYVAEIDLTAQEGYAFPDDITDMKVAVRGSTDLSMEFTQDDESVTHLSITVAFPITSGSGTGSASQDPSDSASAQSAGSSGTDNEKDSSGSSASEGSSASGGTSSSQTSGSDSADTSASSAYSAYEAAAFSIASAENATVSINVDELDILSVEKGQTATIAMDALDGQSFEGTITAISNEATSGSSSAKYAVTITFEKTEDMRTGMSASATINVEEAENAVLIPVDALQERGGSTFVYTAADDEGNLSGEVEVETGLSNGTQVEITSGLDEGDTVYYLKISSESSDSDTGFGGRDSGNMDFGGGMPDGGMGGGMSDGDMSGGMPGGGDGNMPSGGGRGEQQ